MSASDQAWIELVPARHYFLEYKDLFSRDNGCVWNISLEGLMTFMDDGARQVVASQTDQDGQLTCRGDLWVGLIPPEVIVSAQAPKWARV